MERHHSSRLITLGETLAALVQTGSLAAVTLGALARAMIGAAYGGPDPGYGGGPVRQHCQCCYEPPIRRCGGC